MDGITKALKKGNDQPVAASASPSVEVMPE